MNNAFYLQDSRSYTGDCLMFWCKDGAGYASGLDRLEQYTQAEGVQQNQSRETDIPWPVDYVDARAFLAVDHQCMQSDMAEGIRIMDMVYIQIKGDWNGNDVYWLTKGTKSVDLGRAVAMAYWEACDNYCQPDIKFWPVAYIDSIARKIVHRQALDIEAALRGTGIKLHKPKPYSPGLGRQSCKGCGRFIDEHQRYCGCDNCGESNAP